MGGQGMRKFIDLLNEASLDVDPNAAPAEYEAEDAEHYDALKKTGFFGEQAAGSILMAKSTGRIMLVFRSAKVLEPYTWGNLGGAHSSDERPIDAARREIHEETGYTGEIKMVPLFVFRNGSFRYSNFLGIIDDEFEPHLGWEADKHVWTRVGHWPSPLHFGMESLFGDAESLKVIRHYAAMFANGEELSEDVDLNKAIDAAKDQLKDLVDGEDSEEEDEAEGQEQPDPNAPPPAPDGQTNNQQPKKPEEKPKKNLSPMGLSNRV